MSKTIGETIEQLQRDLDAVWGDKSCGVIGDRIQANLRRLSQAAEDNSNDPEQIFIAKLKSQDTFVGSFLWQLDRLEEHFTKDGRIVGPGRWRNDEIARCFESIERAQQEHLQRCDAITKEVVDEPSGS